MKMKKVCFVFFLCTGFLFLYCTSAAAAGVSDESTGTSTLYLKPARTDSKIIIDAELTEPAWQTTPIEEDFITYEPIFGDKLPYKTQVWAAFDNQHLYFAFLCYDPEPSSIQNSITKRDNMFNDDWVSVSIDATGSGQTAYVLYVNPSGIQGDSLVSGVGGEDKSPDFVWHSAGKMTSTGYQVEIALPLKSISFKSGKEVKMGLLFRRRLTRLGSTGAWPALGVGHSILDSQVKAVYQGLRKQLRLEILPSVTYANNRTRETIDQWEQTYDAAEFGVGVKYAIASSITADIAVNPDFSQVESDAFQVEVNQRYPLFYDEKRPFFMEGADIFKFYTFSNGFFPKAVHTRRIIDPAWGAKITGSTGKISFGILSAGDEWPGQPWLNDVNPDQGKDAFFGIARGKYSLGKDNYFGFLYSGREFAGQYNRVVGADFGYRIGKNQKVNASFLHSMSGGNTNGCLDASDSDNSIYLTYKYDSKALGFMASYEHIGENFEMESAYLMRRGIHSGFLWLGIGLYPEYRSMPWLKMISPDVKFQYTRDIQTGMDDIYLKTALYLITTNEGSLTLNYKYLRECWQGFEFDLDQLLIISGVRLDTWIKTGINYSYGDRIYYDGDPAFKGQGHEVSFYLDLQPNRKMNQYISFTHSDLSAAGEKIYDVNLIYSRTTYQFNKYFFLRAVIQYDSFEKRILTDLLASFTLIPGTVLHIGYGGLYENRTWQDNEWLYHQGDMIELKRNFFAKVSYLWRF